jgi:hypothetical protein
VRAPSPRSPCRRRPSRPRRALPLRRPPPLLMAGASSSSSAGSKRSVAVHIQRWKKVSSRSGSPRLGDERPVCSGLDLSSSSSGSVSSREVLDGCSAAVVGADAAGRIPVKDRLVWEEPHLSKKKKWRHRKAKQRRMVAGGSGVAGVLLQLRTPWTHQARLHL